MKLTEANWAVRDHNVTASEVGALLDAHPFITRSAIFNRLVMGAPRQEPNEQMHVGSLMEPVLLQLAAERLGTRVIANSRTYQHPRVPLCATPDAYIPGTRDLVELKATGSQWRFASGLPADIEWQCRAQMACTHRQRVHVIVLQGLTVAYFVVERHRGKERRMTQAVESFWRDHVLTAIPPDDPREELILKTNGKRKRNVA